VVRRPQNFPRNDTNQTSKYEQDHRGPPSQEEKPQRRLLLVNRFSVCFRPVTFSHVGGRVCLCCSEG